MESEYGNQCFTQLFVLIAWELFFLFYGQETIFQMLVWSPVQRIQFQHSNNRTINWLCNCGACYIAQIIYSYSVYISWTLWMKELPNFWPTNVVVFSLKNHTATKQKQKRISISSRPTVFEGFYVFKDTFYLLVCSV